MKASGFYSKQDPDLFTQLAVQNEIVPGQRKMEDNTKLSLFSKYSCENQKTPELENQRRTLEEIFRNGESGQEKTNSLLSVVKEILKKAFQKVLENTEHCSLLGGTVQNSLEEKVLWKMVKGQKYPGIVY